MKDSVTRSDKAQDSLRRLAFSEAEVGLWFDFLEAGTCHKASGSLGPVKMSGECWFYFFSRLSVCVGLDHKLDLIFCGQCFIISLVLKAFAMLGGEPTTVSVHSQNWVRSSDLSSLRFSSWVLFSGFSGYKDGFL